MSELTWADIARQDAEREAKREAGKRDLVERLARILAKEFSAPELALIKSNALGLNAVLIESFEIARQNTKRR